MHSYILAEFTLFFFFPGTEADRHYSFSPVLNLNHEIEDLSSGKAKEYLKLAAKESYLSYLETETNSSGLLVKPVGPYSGSKHDPGPCALCYWWAVGHRG